MVSPMNSDIVICREYEEIPEAVDDILTDPDVLQRLLTAVNENLPPQSRFSAKDLGKRLLTLRKRGQDNGGLVRKHRSYSGRNEHN